MADVLVMRSGIAASRPLTVNENGSGGDDGRRGARRCRVSTPPISALARRRRDAGRERRAQDVVPLARARVAGGQHRRRRRRSGSVSLDRLGPAREVDRRRVVELDGDRLAVDEQRVGQSRDRRRAVRTRRRGARRRTARGRRARRDRERRARAWRPPTSADRGRAACAASPISAISCTALAAGVGSVAAGSTSDITGSMIAIAIDGSVGSRCVSSSVCR